MGEETRHEPAWSAWRYCVRKNGDVLYEGNCVLVAKDTAARKKAQLWRNHESFSGLVIDYAEKGL